MPNQAEGDQRTRLSTEKRAGAPALHIVPGHCFALVQRLGTSLNTHFSMSVYAVLSPGGSLVHSL